VCRSDGCGWDFAQDCGCGCTGSGTCTGCVHACQSIADYDTYVDSSPANSGRNYCSENLVTVGFAQGTIRYYGAVRFDFCCAEIAGKTIDSATLKMGVFASTSSAADIVVDRMGGNWSECGLNYNNYGSTVNDPYAFCSLSGGVCTFDVKSIVQAWASDSSSCGRGFALHSSKSPSTGGYVSFPSSESSGLGQKPYLDVRYH